MPISPMVTSLQQKLLSIIFFINSVHFTNVSHTIPHALHGFSSQTLPRGYIKTSYCIRFALSHSLSLSLSLSLWRHNARTYSLSAIKRCAETLESLLLQTGLNSRWIYSMSTVTHWSSGRFACCSDFIAALSTHYRHSHWLRHGTCFHTERFVKLSCVIDLRKTRHISSLPGR